MAKQLRFLSALLYIGAISAAAAQAQAPTAVDLSESPAFPPIINQGGIGSCDWCAVTYYQMTFLYNTELGRKAAPENSFSPQFGYNFLNNAAPFPANIRIDDVYLFAMRHGMASVADVPYDQDYRPWRLDESLWRKAIPYRIKGYEYFTYKRRAYGASKSFDSEDELIAEIKAVIAGGEILTTQTEPQRSQAIGIIADDPSTEADDPFVGEKIVIRGNNGPDHTMAVVGYNDSLWADANGDGAIQPEEKGAIKLVDSYGPVNDARRNAGFYWMSYATVAGSTFQSRFNRMSIRSGYSPKVLARIVLSTAKRDSLKIQFGRSKAKKAENIPLNGPGTFDPSGFGFTPGTSKKFLSLGGDCAFDGGDKAVDGAIVVDLTEVATEIAEGRYYVRIANSSDVPCEIKAFDVVDPSGAVLAKDSRLPFILKKGEVVRFAK